MGWWVFYWRWLKRAFWRAPGVVDGYLFAPGLAVGLLAKEQPLLAGWLNDMWALVLVYALAFVTVGRLVLAPYWIWREDQEALGTLRRAAASDAQRKAIRMEFAQFIVEGEALMARS